MRCRHLKDRWHEFQTVALTTTSLYDPVRKAGHFLEVTSPRRGKDRFFKEGK